MYETQSDPPGSLHGRHTHYGNGEEIKQFLKCSSLRYYWITDWLVEYPFIIKFGKIDLPMLFCIYACFDFILSCSFGVNWWSRREIFTDFTKTVSIVISCFKNSLYQKFPRCPVVGILQSHFLDLGSILDLGTRIPQGHMTKREIKINCFLFGHWAKPLGRENTSFFYMGKEYEKKIDMCMYN